MPGNDELLRAHAAFDTEIFISYRNRDGTAPQAQLLAELLSQRGMHVFWDADRIAAGDMWRPVLATALESPKLAVGVVLMTPEWFGHFNLDFDEDVVRWEVDTLLATQHVKVIPVVLRDQSTGDVLPSIPEGAANPDELVGLKSRLDVWQSRFVPPRTAQAMRHLADEIVDAALQTALGRPLRKGVAAGRTPPLPLHVLHAEPDTGRRLLDMATMFERHGRQHRFMTIRGQDALVAHDWEPAVAHLSQARDNLGHQADVATRADDDSDWAFRSHLWRIHAHNLLVVASLGGHRPRRQQISDAERLLRHLVKAIEIGAMQLGPWPPGDDAQSKADRASAHYVLQMTLDLTWLIWQDFYEVRNVRPRDMDDDGLLAIKRWLGQIGLLIEGLRPRSDSSLAAGERRFLVDGTYLDGFPAASDAAGPWREGQTFDQLARFIDDELRRKHGARILRELEA